MTELEYVIRHGGLSPKPLLTKITRRGFGATVLGGLAGMAASSALGSTSAAPANADFTLAIIPDPQFLAESCPDNLGDYYSGMMNWIVDHRNMVFSSSPPAFGANIKAVIGVGDCVNSTVGANEFKNAQTAWTILDTNRIAFTTPPGNHDYVGLPSARSNLGDQFSTGYFSATNRAAVYGSGIDLGAGDRAYWIGSYDNTGANTAVKFVISGVKLLVVAMDFFAGNDAWSWAYDVVNANADCESYITTHAWLTRFGTHFQRADTYGPGSYGMPASGYSNSASEAWNNLRVSAWPQLHGIFCGHDISGGTIVDTTGALPEWYWQHVPTESESWRKQTVHQVFANSQQLDANCSIAVDRTTGAGQIASVFLLSRRPQLGLLEGRMISTYSGNWFGAAPGSASAGESWSVSETLLFSVPFARLPKTPTPIRECQSVRDQEAKIHCAPGK